MTSIEKLVETAEIAEIAETRSVMPTLQKFTNSLKGLTMTRTKSTATAEQIAHLHQHLGEAHAALRQAMGVGDARRIALTTGSWDAMKKLADRISGMAFGLEADMARATGRRDVPFARPEQPTVWVDWLAAQDPAHGVVRDEVEDLSIYA